MLFLIVYTKENMNKNEIVFFYPNCTAHLCLTIKWFKVQHACLLNMYLHLQFSLIIITNHSNIYYYYFKLILATFSILVVPCKIYYLFFFYSLEIK